MGSRIPKPRKKQRYGRLVVIELRKVPSFAAKIKKVNWKKK
jgi:hypothetical protein